VTKDDNARFEILNLLGEMQYAPALPYFTEVLEKDPEEYYWQSRFCFGKMGDRAIPFLVGKLNDKNENIKANAMIILGQWLLAVEARKPFQQLYWKENDPKIRMFLLSALERMTPNLQEMELFFREVATKERDSELKQFATETLSRMGNMKTQALAFQQAKLDNRKSFEAEYAILYSSAGKEGDMKKLGSYSRPDDEPRLKKLRERILTRNSDEAFYDYEKVNVIIMLNRLIQSPKNSL